MSDGHFRDKMSLARETGHRGYSGTVGKPTQLSHHQNFSLQFARVTYEIGLIIDIIDIDDTKLWQQIKNYGDNKQLQNDLHSLEHWSNGY